MSGTYSVNSTNQLEIFSDGASQIPSITLCDPRQLKPQRYSQTLAEIPTKNFIVDRESGKTLIVQHPSFELMMSDSSLSFRSDWNRLPLSKFIALLKCLLILQSLPESALEEAAEELQGIADFYSDRFSQANLSTIPASRVKGKLKSAQVRPPIVVEP